MKLRLWLVLCAALAACGPVDLVVVSVADAGGFNGNETPCSRSSQCMPGQFCEKTACNAPLGKCIAQPAACTGELQMKCGCDGVNYWNDCLRRAAGVEANLDDRECAMPRPCDAASNPCPNDGYCARFVPRTTDCGRIPPGRCFVLPEVACVGPTPKFVPACGGACVDWCEAIKSEQVMARPPPGTCP